MSGIDITLPGKAPRLGTRHPITQTIDEFKDIMARFGFTAVEGPEIEDEQHNFTALNIPQEHPARDPLDNFYLASAGVAAGGPVLLRSQTSTVQIRVMEQTPPPIRIVSLGRVYRPDTQDDTHSCMFHQMEGLMVDRDVTMAQLKTVLALFAKAYLGEDVKVRFRPSFFPFTEPSVEVDMLWGENWIEVGGAGMVDPERAPRGRLRSRGCHRLRLRPRRRTLLHASPRRQKHPPLLRKRRSLPAAILSVARRAKLRSEPPG